MIHPEIEEMPYHILSVTGSAPMTHRGKSGFMEGIIVHSLRGIFRLYSQICPYPVATGYGFGAGNSRNFGIREYFHDTTRNRIF